MSTATSSHPSCILDGITPGMARVFMAQTTYVSSAILPTGFWQGYGEGSRGNSNSPTWYNSVGMRVGDVLMHISTTNSATPGRVSLHSVIGVSANVASTVLSSGYNAAYDVTVASAT